MLKTGDIFPFKHKLQTTSKTTGTSISLDTIIDASLTWFSTGRYFGENVRLLLVIDNGYNNSEPGLIFFQNSKKAFESVNHDLKSLENFDFSNTHVID